MCREKSLKRKNIKIMKLLKDGAKNTITIKELSNNYNF